MHKGRMVIDPQPRLNAPFNAGALRPKPSDPGLKAGQVLEARMCTPPRARGDHQQFALDSGQLALDPGQLSFDQGQQDVEKAWQCRRSL